MSMLRIAGYGNGKRLPNQTAADSTGSDGREAY